MGGALFAARIGDQIGNHGSGWSDFWKDMAIGLAVGALIVAVAVVVVCTGGLAVGPLMCVVVGATALSATFGVWGGLAGIDKRHRDKGKSQGGGTHRGSASCSSVKGPGSPNVYIENLKAARSTQDSGTHGSVLITQGAKTVIVNGFPLVREGDSVKCGGMIIHGCEHTYIGGPSIGTVTDDGPSDGLINGLKYTSAVFAAIATVAALAAAAVGTGAVYAGSLLVGKKLLGSGAMLLGGHYLHEFVKGHFGDDAADYTDMGVSVALSLFGSLGVKGLAAETPAAAPATGTPAIKPVTPVVEPTGPVAEPTTGVLEPTGAVKPTGATEPVATGGKAGGSTADGTSAPAANDNVGGGAPRAPTAATETAPAGGAPKAPAVKEGAPAGGSAETPTAANDNAPAGGATKPTTPANENAPSAGPTETTPGAANDNVPGGTTKAPTAANENAPTAGPTESPTATGKGATPDAETSPTAGPDEAPAGKTDAGAAKPVASDDPTTTTEPTTAKTATDEPTTPTEPQKAGPVDEPEDPAAAVAEDTEPSFKPGKPPPPVEETAPPPPDPPPTPPKPSPKCTTCAGDDAAAAAAAKTAPPKTPWSWKAPELFGKEAAEWSNLKFEKNEHLFEWWPEPDGNAVIWQSAYKDEKGKEKGDFGTPLVDGALSKDVDPTLRKWGVMAPEKEEGGEEGKPEGGEGKPEGGGEGKKEGGGAASEGGEHGSTPPPKE